MKCKVVVALALVLGLAAAFSTSAGAGQEASNVAVDVARAVASATTLSIIGQDAAALEFCGAHSSTTHAQWLSDRVKAFREYRLAKRLVVTSVHTECRDIQILSASPSMASLRILEYVAFSFRLGADPSVATSEMVYEHNMRLRVLTGDRWVVVEDAIPENPAGDDAGKHATRRFRSAVTPNVGIQTYQYSYTRSGAVSYANTYWSSYNVGPYKDMTGADCTNFMSQCMHSGGGLPYHNSGMDPTNYSNWWYDNKGTTGSTQTGDDTWSNSWAVADMLHTYILCFNDGNGYDVGSATELSLGDIVFYDWDANGVQNHAAIVTSFSDGQPLVTAHDNDRHNVLWDLEVYDPDPRTLYTFTHLNGVWYYN